METLKVGKDRKMVDERREDRISTYGLLVGFAINQGEWVGRVWLDLHGLAKETKGTVPTKLVYRKFRKDGQTVRMELEHGDQMVYEEWCELYAMPEYKWYGVTNAEGKRSSMGSMRPRNYCGRLLWKAEEVAELYHSQVLEGYDADSVARNVWKYMRYKGE